MYRLKAAEQLLYVLRTKNLRLLPLEDADAMVATAQEEARRKGGSRAGSTPGEGADSDTVKLSNQAFYIRTQWQKERPPASLPRALKRSENNAQWFDLMQEEYKYLLKELAVMRMILGVTPGQFSSEAGGDDVSADGAKA